MQFSQFHFPDTQVNCQHCQAQVNSDTESLLIHCKTCPNMARMGNFSLYKCLVCSYYTGHSTTMRCHLRAHLGEKPFKCHLCNHASAHKSNLNSHIKIKHGLY